MKFLELFGGSTPAHYSYQLNELMPEELCLIRPAEGATPESTRELLKVFAKKSRLATLVLEEENLPSSPWLDAAKRAGIRNILVRMALRPGPGQLGAYEAIHHRAPLDRSATARTFLELRRALAEKFSLFPLLVPQPETVPVLLPTLVALADAQVAWAHLDPHLLDINQDCAGIKNAFKHLRMLQKTRMQIQFTPYRENSRAWSAKSENLFSGPVKIDFDISNTCTHNCTFCTFYSDDAMNKHKAANGGKMAKDLKALLSAKLDLDHGMKFLNDLPDTLEFIQFGGIGDPYTHPKVDDLIAVARRRGFNCGVLSNFSYMTPQRIEKLHPLGGPNGWGLHYTVNLSAASEDSYVKVRPNQSKATFRKVLDSIRHATELRHASGNRGIGFTLLLVLNKFNFRDMTDFVSLAKELDVMQAWIKPMEFHADFHKNQLPAEHEMPEYKALVQESLGLAGRLKLNLLNGHILENLVTN